MINDFETWLEKCIAEFPEIEDDFDRGYQHAFWEVLEEFRAVMGLPR